MVKPEIINKLRKFYRSLENAGVRVAKMVIYGSYASGKYRKDSDIDVAVVSKDFGRDRIEEGVKISTIAYKIDPRIESIPISLKSYNKDTWIPLIYEIRRKGIVVRN